jgi:hypothetical protein
MNNDNNDNNDEFLELSIFADSFFVIGRTLRTEAMLNERYADKGGLQYWNIFKCQIEMNHCQRSFKRLSKKISDKDLIKRNIELCRKLKEYKIKQQSHKVFYEFINKLFIKMKIEKAIWASKIKKIEIEANKKNKEYKDDDIISDVVSDISNKETTGSNTSDRQFDFDPYQFLKTPTKIKKDSYFKQTGKTKYPGAKQPPKPPKINDINIKTNTNSISYIPYLAMGAGVLAVVLSKMKKN